ncbi:MAG: mechanosensitive ion channel family protein [candidate division Zixibacteria bacterium]|nr:mechanosensitive ion channel family protein [candidate division Zixibacteria bacterium]
MDLHEVWRLIGEWLLSSGLRVLVIIILCVVALRLARVLPARLIATFTRRETEGEALKRIETLSSLLRYVLTALVLSLGMVMIMGEFGISIGPILAAAGVAGLALGFGAQHLVQDIISGFFILLDDQIRVGDVVQTAGKDGVVERVNLRMTVLRDFSGNVHYIRNGQIDIVTNMTKEYSRYVFNIGVSYREDVDEVIAVIREVDEDMRRDPEYGRDILEPIEILGLDEFADSAVIVKARTKTKPIKQWRVKREFNRRLKKAFDARNIEIPFPHVTLYMGEDKDGSAPALHVRQTREQSG